MNQTVSTVGQTDPVAIGFFFLFVFVSLGVTFWAARRTRSTEDFYAAGRAVSGVQNGFAVAGDFIAAAGFLGIGGFVSLAGFDGLIYAIGGVVAWPVTMFLLAEPLRNLGRYTVADVLTHRLGTTSVRVISAIGSLTVIFMYLILQMVGAGTVVHLVFGLSYEAAVIITGGIMTLYVLFGGMIATTWVQIIKAVLMLFAAFLLAGLVLGHFGFNPVEVFKAASARSGVRVLAPGNAVSSPIEAISLGLGLVFGVASLPHVLMRFFTVPDARAARRSLLYATGLIGAFELTLFAIGFGAMALVGPEAIRAADKGGNLAIPLLAELLGGSAFLGFIAAVAFATILAVVAGLVISGAATLSHDLWVSTFRRGKATEREQLVVAKVATVLLCVICLLLGLLFKGQNIAFLVGLTVSVAASTNFPALTLAIFWPRLSPAGAISGVVAGFASSLLIIYLSPLIQVDILHHAAPVIALRNPGIVSIPLAFIVTIVVSLLTPGARAKDFAKFQRQALVGWEDA